MDEIWMAMRPRAGRCLVTMHEGPASLLLRAHLPAPREAHALPLLCAAIRAWTGLPLRVAVAAAPNHDWFDSTPWRAALDLCEVRGIVVELARPTDRQLSLFRRSR